MNRTAGLICLLLLTCAGCESEVPDESSMTPEPAASMGSAFNRASTGRVTGRVTWTGSIPNPPGFLYGVPRADGRGFEFRTAKNPNRPQIDRATRAVAGAVVYLRGIDPAKCRPWDLPPVSVEVGDGQITVVQGGHRGRSGFVRRGDAIAITSTEPKYHVLRGRGDGFFSLTLPEPNRPVSRVLKNPGRVELSSGTGMYWANADLFVAEHPYYTLTGSEGRFAFDSVPTGAVEVVVWLPSWQPGKQERDPDSTQVARQAYAAPFERTASAFVAAHTTVVDVKVP